MRYCSKHVLGSKNDDKTCDQTPRQAKQASRTSSHGESTRNLRDPRGPVGNQGTCRWLPTRARRPILRDGIIAFGRCNGGDRWMMKRRDSGASIWSRNILAVSRSPSGAASAGKEPLWPRCETRDGITEKAHIHSSIHSSVHSSIRAFE